MKTEIYAVLHGDKVIGADPAMTSEGVKQIEALRELLPTKPSHVLVGTGDRHHDVSEALELKVTASTPLLGDPSSLENVEGNLHIVFANGNTCPLARDRSIADIALAVIPFLRTLKHNTVLCTGRPFAKALIKALKIEGMDPKNASVIKIMLSSNKIWVLETFKALGETEANK